MLMCKLADIIAQIDKGIVALVGVAMEPLEDALYCRKIITEF